jgi:DNA-binding PadR family transcriptional regulator
MLTSPDPVNIYQLRDTLGTGIKAKSVGSIYSSMGKYVNKGWVVGSTRDRRNYFALTDVGRAEVTALYVALIGEDAFKVMVGDT